MEKKFLRNQQRKMIAGVAAGLADYLDINVSLIRLIFVLMVVFGFSGILLYILLWLIVPDNINAPLYPTSEVDYRVYEGAAEQKRGKEGRKNRNGRRVAGLVLIAVGVLFLLFELKPAAYWMSIAKLWPIVLIAFGVIMLSRSGKTKNRADGEETLQTENFENESSNKTHPLA